MKKEIFKIGFFACLVMSAIFAVLVISNSIILNNIVGSGLSISIYRGHVQNNTLFLFIFGIGMIIFKGLEIYFTAKELKETK